MPVPGIRPRALEVGGEHVEVAFLAPCLQVHASDQALAGEHREAIVPVTALVGRLVDLDSLLEVEQGPDPCAIPEQRIERRQQDTSIAARPQAFEIGQTLQIFAPDPAGEGPPRGAKRARKDPALLLQALQRGTNPVAALHQAPGRGQRAGGSPAVTGEGAQQEGVEGRPGAHAPGTDLGGNDPFDEIETALKAAALANGQSSCEPQRLGHAASELEVPPAGAAPAFQVEGAQRPFALDAFQDRSRHLRMLAQHIAPPRMHLVLPAPPFEAGVEGERQPARLVAPVLEQRRPRGEQRLSERGVETVQPGGEHDAVGAGPAHGDGVELQVAEVLDDAVAAFSRHTAAHSGAFGETEAARREQAGTRESEPPRLRDADGLARWGHVPGSERDDPARGAPRPSLRSARPAARYMTMYTIRRYTTAEPGGMQMKLIPVRPRRPISWAMRMVS